MHFPNELNLSTNPAQDLRQLIRAEVAQIVPLDEAERCDQARVLTWIDSGAQLCRVQKPDVPPQHLIAYFVVVDADEVLLVDHINAGLWLPTGGHVDVGEHPRETVRREVVEELGITADFACPGPVFVSVTKTVGRTAGHTDVSLWYVLKGDKHRAYVFDTREFNAVRWFHRAQIPKLASDPQMARFVQKWKWFAANP